MATAPGADRAVAGRLNNEEGRNKPALRSSVRANKGLLPTASLPPPNPPCHCTALPLALPPPSSPPPAHLSYSPILLEDDDTLIAGALLLPGSSAQDFAM